MRLYAFLLLALCALAARAATIPETVATPSEKKIEVVPIDKIPENVSSEQELVDQANTINDVDNKLRVKPADIPVEVIVEKVEPALKTSDKKDDSEEIVRPAIDLRNPGPPQRQEHETQNPQFYAAEQQIVQSYKQNINDAQVILRQGFQSVSENIQNMLQNNEQVQLIQQSIQSLQDGFIEQINKLNGTIQGYLNNGINNNANTGEQQTKSNIQTVETGLTALKNDFTRGVQTLIDGVEVIASLRADEKPEENPSTSGAAPSPAGTGNILLDYINRLQNSVQTGMTNLQQTLNNYVTQTFPGQQASTTAPVAQPPAETQSDAQAPAAQPTNPWFNIPNPFNGLLNQNQNQAQNVQQDNPQPAGGIGSGNGPIVQLFTQISSGFQNFLNPQGSQTPQAAKPPQTAQPSKPSEPTSSEQKPSETAQPEKKPEETVKPETPASQPSQAVPVTPDGPIRQILQNNPISQSIASAVQRLQNINNPEKPRDPEKEKAVEEPEKVEDKKGYYTRPQNTAAIGSDNNSNRVEDTEPMMVMKPEALPEVQEPTKEESKPSEQKTEQVVDKTE